MITKKAIRRFLARDRRDYEPWKDLSDDDLEARKAKLIVAPPIWDALKKRQKVCLLLGIKEGSFAFFNDTGTGKTMLCLALAAYYKALREHHGYPRKAFLALVPNKSNKGEWYREVKKHTDSGCLVLEGSSEDKWNALRETEADIVVETYAGMMHMVCDTKLGKKGKNRMTPNRTKLARMAKLLAGLFCDESTNVKNRAKLPYRFTRFLSKHCPHVFVLSGTPFGRDPESLWAQMMLVDDGWTLGETLGLFRAAFYKESAGQWGGFEYTFIKSKEAMLHRFLRDRSIRYEIDQGEMPDKRSFLIRCPMPKESQPYYASHRDAVMQARGNYKEMESAFTRMRQISSGFLGYKDDLTGDRAQFEFGKKPKLDALCAFLREHGGKAIVFHEYRFTGKLLVRKFRDMGWGCELLNGASSDRSDEIRERFEHDDDCEILALNNSAGAFGLNLQIAKWAIFYESPVSAIIRRQAERRVERQFSKHKWVGIVDLVTEGTVDEQILEFHAEGASLFEAIIRGKAKPK